MRNGEYITSSSTSRHTYRQSEWNLVRHVLTHQPMGRANQVCRIKRFRLHVDCLSILQEPRGRIYRPQGTKSLCFALVSLNLTGVAMWREPSVGMRMSKPPPKLYMEVTWWCLLALPRLPISQIPDRKGWWLRFSFGDVGDIGKGGQTVVQGKKAKWPGGGVGSAWWFRDHVH